MGCSSGSRELEPTEGGRDRAAGRACLNKAKLWLYRARLRAQGAQTVFPQSTNLTSLPLRRNHDPEPPTASGAWMSQGTFTGQWGLRAGNPGYSWGQTRPDNDCAVLVRKCRCSGMAAAGQVVEADCSAPVPGRPVQHSTSAD